MFDSRTKAPIPTARNVAEFMRKFDDQQACLDPLRKVRRDENPEPFACPGCQHTK